MNRILLSILLFVYSYHSYSQNMEDFIIGLKNSKVSTYGQAEKGETYLYNSKGKSKQIVYMMYQFDILFFIKEEGGQLNQIEVNYEAGLDTSDTELRFLKSHVNFQMGQYDFNGDGLDELIVAIQDPKDMNITINVFKLVKNNFVNIGTFTGNSIDDYPKAFINKKSIKIDRHLRGFYFLWEYANGKFVDKSDV